MVEPNRRYRVVSIPVKQAPNPLLDWVLSMSPADALETFTRRFETFEATVNNKIADLDATDDELKLDFAAIVKEMELTRKSLDRFTAAFGTGSVAIVTAAVSLILFGPVGG
jgi:hypothetical protein